MRTIKFRGKRVNSREWVYSTESIVQTDEGICMGLYNEEKDVIPDTVGQFIGLYDKNGKEIYEGDILLFHGEVKRVVGYEDSHMACFSLLCPYDFSFMSTFGSGSFESFYCEVIGNIHDNPRNTEKEVRNDWIYD